ncbi:MAG: glycosyltransferase family 2 protein [Anaerolineae bacterium]|nr:MAG: glycosyltransferase family 2 protein [Anaerolineae bacterium]
MTPVVTVLMSVYNSAATVGATVESILAQTFADFEFLIVDDASTDESAQVLAGYDDPRLRIVRNERNLGLTASLNRGLEMAQGTFIARMDADDVSRPRRLAKQVAYLNANPDVGMVGSWVQTIGERNEVWRYPTRHEDIRAEMLFNAVHVHSTVMLRREVLEKHNLHYDERLLRAQDYDLWARLGKVTRLANLPETLVEYHLHKGQVGARHEHDQQATASGIRRRLLELMGLAPQDDDMTLHHEISAGKSETSVEYLARVREWLELIRGANKDEGQYQAAALDRALGRRWARLCRRATGLGPIAWQTFRASRLSRASGLNAFQLAKFWLACQLRRGA